MKRHPFPGELGRGTPVAPQLFGTGPERTELVVGVQRIVMEKEQLPDLGDSRESDRMCHARVAPADV
jgi:hypothetical protein